MSAPYYKRTSAWSRQRYQSVVGPSYAESLSWIQRLKSLSSDDLVDAVENDLKQFQTFINRDCKVDLKELSTVISILVQLSQCSVDKREAANRVLAECVSDRCEQFHLKLLRSVQQELSVRIDQIASCEIDLVQVEEKKHLWAFL